jgi:hypothetical protein
LKLLTLDLREMVCRPVDLSVLDQDCEKKRTALTMQGNFWLEYVYFTYQLSNRQITRNTTHHGVIQLGINHCLIIMIINLVDFGKFY